MVNLIRVEKMVKYCNNCSREIEDFEVKHYTSKSWQKSLCDTEDARKLPKKKRCLKLFKTKLNC